MTPISQGGLQWREEVLRGSEHRLILAGCDMLKKKVLATWPQNPLYLLDRRSHISNRAEDLEVQNCSQDMCSGKALFAGPNHTH